MYMNYNFGCVLFVIAIIFTDANAQRAKDKMYEQFKTNAACFRQLNATHQIGCTSDAEGSTGVVHLVEKDSDLYFMLENGTAAPYIPVMPVSLFTTGVANLLKSTDKISGLVLFKQNFSTLSYFTHDSKCPNELSNMDGTCTNNWNRHGTGLLWQDFPFPIFYLEDDGYISKVTECFKKFNNFDYDIQYERSLCSVELSSFMFATTDTPTCLRRSNSKKNLNPVKFCDPLGDENIWASLFPLKNKTDATQKYIILASRMDTTSFFNELDPGAISPITGLVTLLTTANLLKKMLPDNNNYEKNILFILFNGESYDYIGSQRIVYDMQQGEFPMKYDPNIENPVPQIHLENISLFVELSQLSNHKQIVTYTLSKDQEVTHFIKSLRNYSEFANFDTLTDIIPPASLHSFLKIEPKFKGLILADHKEQFVNNFYHSIYDNAENINYRYYNVTPQDHKKIPEDSVQNFVGNVSTMVAKALFEEVTGNKYNGSEKADIILVDELFNCLLLDTNCKVHKAIQKKEYRDVPRTLYVGVSIAPNLITSLIGLTLGWLTGDVIETNDNKTCENDPNNPAFQYFYMSKSLEDLNNTVCFRTTVNFTEAVSPAFIIPDYDWKSGKYSSWAESTWRDFSVRMYLRPSAAHERFTMAIGSITFVLSLVLVYFVKNRSHILFPMPADCSPTSC